MSKFWFFLMIALVLAITVSTCASSKADEWPELPDGINKPIPIPTPRPGN